MNFVNIVKVKLFVNPIDSSLTLINLFSSKVTGELSLSITLSVLISNFVAGNSILTSLAINVYTSLPTKLETSATIFVGILMIVSYKYPFTLIFDNLIILLYTLPLNVRLSISNTILMPANFWSLSCKFILCLNVDGLNIIFFETNSSSVEPVLTPYIFILLGVYIIYGVSNSIDMGVNSCKLLFNCAVNSKIVCFVIKDSPNIFV